MFSVLVALAPIGFDVLMQLIDSSNMDGSDAWHALLKAVSHGQLLLISTAIAADAVGDLIGTSKASEFVKNLAGGGCVLTILFGALWYANLAAGSRGESVVPEHRMARICSGSLAVFTLTLVSSGGAKLVASENEA